MFGSKLCGISDIVTLKYILSHKHPPKFVGMIMNYKRSPRYITIEKAKELTNIQNDKVHYVAVLVKPTDEDFAQLKDMNFRYYQIYDLSPEKIKKIKDKYNKKIIVALKIETIDDVLNYKKFESIADIILFDSQGYEKSLSFDHKLLNKVPNNISKMLAGNIKIEDDFSKLKKYCSYIDVSSALESAPGVKDIKKIDLLLNKVHNTNIEI